MHFFYVVDFPQRKLSCVKIGVTNNLVRRLEEMRRNYGNKAKVLYVKCCETSQECDDLEDLSRIILRGTPGFLYQPKDRFIYNFGERPPTPVPINTNITYEVCYL